MYCEYGIPMRRTALAADEDSMLSGDTTCDVLGCSRDTVANVSHHRVMPCYVMSLSLFCAAFVSRRLI